MLAVIKTQAGKTIEFEVESYNINNTQNGLGAMTCVQLVKPSHLNLELLPELRNNNFSLKVGSIDWRACRLFLFINDVTQGGPFLEITQLAVLGDFQYSVKASE